MEEDLEQCFYDGDFDQGSFPLEYALEKEILMHRDVHFAGDFASMVAYYQKEGRGAVLEVTLQQIQDLWDLEKKLSTNLAAQVLSGADAERVAHAKAAYVRLREVYERNLAEDDPAKLIADLILAEEDEEDCLQAVIEKGSCMQKPLLDLLHSTEFADDLCPGYGLCPLLAAKALAKIGDQEAIEALFVLLDDEREDLVFELLDALKELGAPACQFAQRVLTSLPISQDNRRAAFLLSSVFSDNEESAKAAFSLLCKHSKNLDTAFLSMLILMCASLKEQVDRVKFQNWASQEDLSTHLQEDLKAVYHDWATIYNDLY